MKHRWPVVLLLILACAVVIAAPASYRVESMAACSSSEVAESAKALLQDQGQRVIGDKGTLCDVWLRKSLPLKPGSSSPDYSSLSLGSFVGVVTFPIASGDYRGQGIKPGTYTMRYQTMPADGNHMGVSPTQEYVLLSPAAEDKNPSADVDYEALLNLSRKASGTDHPTPLYLVPAVAGGAAPFRDAGNGHWVLEIKTKAQPAGGAAIDFPIAFVIIGKGEG